jgi:hypothetical protein
MFWMSVCRLSYPACKAHLRYFIVIYGLSDSTALHRTFPHYLINARFFKNDNEHDTCVLIYSKPFAWNISHGKKNSARYYHKFLHVKYPLFMSDYNQNWIFSTECRKFSNIKCYENPSSGCWVVSMRTKRHTDGQVARQTDMTKLVVVFAIFRKRLKVSWISTFSYAFMSCQGTSLPSLCLRIT